MIQVDQRIADDKPSASKEVLGKPKLFKRTKINKVAGPEHAHLPVHAKKVPPINLAALLQVARDPVSKRIKTLFTDLTRVAKSGTPSKKFQIPKEDLFELQRAGVLERADPKVPANDLLYFSVLELSSAGTWRRRPITWPCEYHKAKTYLSQLSLPHTPAHANLVNDGTHAVVFDCSASFWQIPLPQDCNFVVTDEAGDTWRFSRLPYGLDCASEVMQLVLDELIHLSEVDGVKTASHIDGLIAAGDRDSVATFAQNFKKQCQIFGVTLNVEDGNEPSAKTTFTGMRFDFDNKKIQLSKKFTDSIPKLKDVRTMEDLQSLHGKLLYGAAVA